MSFQGPDMSDTIEIPPRSGTAFVVKKGQAFTVIDPQGTQVSDMVAYAQGDVREVMSNGRTFGPEQGQTTGIKSDYLYGFVLIASNNSVSPQLNKEIVWCLAQGGGNSDCLVIRVRAQTSHLSLIIIST